MVYMCAFRVSQENGPMMKSEMKSPKRMDNQEKLKAMGKRQICLKCINFKRILRNGCIRIMARREKDKYIAMFTVTSMTANSRNKLLHPPSRDLPSKYHVQSCWDAPHQSPSPMLTNIYAYWSGKAMQPLQKRVLRDLIYVNLCTPPAICSMCVGMLRRTLTNVDSDYLWRRRVGCYLLL